MFIWDAANTSHIARHGVLPEEAEYVVLNHPLDLERQFRNGEERTYNLGETKNGRILVVVATMRKDLIRIVTAHPADRNMRRFYSTQRRLNHGQDA